MHDWFSQEYMVCLRGDMDSSHVASIWINPDGRRFRVRRRSTTGIVEGGSFDTLDQAKALLVLRGLG